MLSKSRQRRLANWISHWSKIAAILLAASVLMISIDSARSASAAPRNIPTHGSYTPPTPLPFYKDAISGLAYQARKDIGVEKAGGAGKNDTQARNVAIGFVDVTEMTNGSTATEIQQNFRNRLNKYLSLAPDKGITHPFEDIANLARVIDVTSPSAGDLPLLAELKAHGALGQGVKMLLVLPTINNPKAEAGKKAVQHSEDRLKEELVALGLSDKDSQNISTLLIALYSERYPCTNCDPRIPGFTKVFASVDPWEDALAEVKSAQIKYEAIARKKELPGFVLTPGIQKEIKEAEDELQAAIKYANGVKSVLQEAGQSTPDMSDPSMSNPRSASKQIAEALEKENKAEREKNPARSPKEINRKSDEKKAAALGAKVENGEKGIQAMLAQPAAPCPKTSALGLPVPDNGHAIDLAAWSAASPCPDEEGKGAPGALAEALQASNLGGIDFSTLQMRYMSDSPDASGLQYSFAGQRAGSGAKQNIDSALGVLTKNAADLRTWLVLPPSDFWVNLNPSEPDRIIDPQMGETNAGKAMLQADLQLKTTSAKLEDPRTKLGAQYWKEMAGSSHQLCYGSRMWIVPGDVQVREDGGSLYILKAQLAVKAVPDHVATGDSRCHYNAAVDARGKYLDDTMIVPRITKAVNTAPEYAAIRQAFTARVVAQWIRDRHQSGQQTSFDKLIDSGNIGPAKLQDGWKPRQVFDTYVHQLKSGLFTYKTTVRQGNYLWRETTTVGGVDFTNLHPTTVSAVQMNKQDPLLAQTVKASTRTLTTGPDGSMWLGDTIAQPASSHASAVPRPGSAVFGRTGILVLIVAALGVVTLGVRGSGRKRRRKAP